MSKIIRLPSDVYLRLEKHAAGFDTPANVIEKLLNHYEGEDPIVRKTPFRTKDTTKYYFNGSKYGKGRLVLAVVTDYVLNHPNIHFEELEVAFPKATQGSIGVFNTLEHSNNNSIRYYVKQDEVIGIADGDITICNQWGVGNIGKFIEQAETLGYAITSTAGDKV